MSESAVDQAAQAARGSRVLMDQTLSLERLVRQYFILNDKALLDDYEKVRANFKRTTSELSLLPLDEYQLAELNRTIDKEQALYETLKQRPVDVAERRRLADGYGDLSGLAKNVVNESNLLIERDVERMRATANAIQRSLFMQMLAAFPLGLAIAALFAFLIARPDPAAGTSNPALGRGGFRRGH